MELSKEEANTRETVEVYRRYKQVVEGISDAEELLSEKLRCGNGRNGERRTF